MDKNQRPHSREKTVGTGSADVNKGRKVNTGGRPVGGGSRESSNRENSSNRGVFTPGSNSFFSGGSSNQSSNPFGSSQQSNGFVPFSSASQSSSKPAAGKKLSLKRILILALAVIILISLLKSCSRGLFTDFGGSSFSGGGYDIGSSSGSSGISSGNSSYGQIALPTTPASPTAPASNSSSVDLTVASEARAKRVIPLGGGKDVVTIMVYMCGTDLESRSGMATKDLQEMVKATISDRVNLIVETGGCKQWRNNIVSNSKNQIYKVETGGLVPLEQDFGTSAMTDPDNLTRFIEYCTENYPADRNMLIFWDHGGGSVSGYGYDEKYSGASSMTLDLIDKALDKTDCVFDMIGYDACLMATLENALVCNKYADYLLASEESEPGTGWDYTGWLNALSANSSLPTTELGRIIIDDFVSASNAASPSAKVTLSLVDLAELQGTVPGLFNEFAVSTTELITGENYQQVSNARAGVRQFAQSSRINQVDLVDLALRIDTVEANELAEALRGCVKYNRSTMSRCYGISIFFPYESTSGVKKAISLYQTLGMDAEYTRCIQSFASLEYSGQIAASSSQSAVSSAYGGDMLDSLLNAYSSSGSSTSPLDALFGFSGSPYGSSYGSSYGGYSSYGGSSYGSSSAGYGLDASTILDLLGAFSGRSMPADYDWVDTRLVADNARSISLNFIDPARITATEKNGESVLSLSDEEWGLLQTVELNLFVDDGEGFIDLGLDNTFAWTDDGNLLLDFDGTWLTLNGNVCAYYLVSDTQQDDGSWVTVGRIPALLNGAPVNLQVVFDDDHPSGVITGATPIYPDGETDVQAKGDIPVEAGDTLELLCDYYGYGGSYSASYTLGSSFTVPADGLNLTNLALSTDAVSVTYRFTDIYGNHYWLPIALG